MPAMFAIIAIVMLCLLKSILIDILHVYHLCCCYRHLEAWPVEDPCGRLAPDRLNLC